MNNDEYKLYKKCRFCGSKNVTRVINLGKTPLAGGFLINKKYFKTEKKYPLELLFCKDCYLLQTSISINPDTLFKNYFYFSSSIKTLVDHFYTNAKEFKKLIDPKNSFVVEIGSNDGSFLEAMRKNKAKILGVDPATNVVKRATEKGIPMINDYFTKDVAEQIIKKYGKADLIFSSNTLAHIEDMHTVFSGIKKLLKNDGKLIFEVHYLPDLINSLQYDMIYHEHQYYYSLLCLEKFLKRFGLIIYDAKKILIHGGSIQIFASKNQGVKRSSNLIKLLEQEKKNKIDKVETYHSFNEKIKQSKIDLLKLVNKLNKTNTSIMGYGASGRGTIMVNYCNLNINTVKYVIDDAPAKIGSFMPGTHQEIVSSEILDSKNKPDYVILFAWSFLNEIVSKNKDYLKSGGKFITPLPKPKIL